MGGVVPSEGGGSISEEGGVSCEGVKLVVGSLVCVVEGGKAYGWYLISWGWRAVCVCMCVCVCADTQGQYFHS